MCKLPVSLRQTNHLWFICRSWNGSLQGLVLSHTRHVSWLGRWVNQGTWLQVTESSSQVNFIKKKYLLTYLGTLRYSWLWVELGPRAYMILEVSLGFLSLFVSVHVSTLASFCCPVERFPPCDLERWPVISLKFKFSQNCDSKGKEELHLIWTNIAVTWRTLAHWGLGLIYLWINHGC